MTKADKLLELKELLDREMITQNEYEEMKKKVLDSNETISDISESTINTTSSNKKASHTGCIVIFVILIFFLVLLTSIIVEIDTNTVNQSTDTEQPSSTINQSADFNQPEGDFTTSDGKFTLVSKEGKFDGYFTTITGEIKNNTNRTYSYVQITFNLYDGSGAQVGTAMDNINNFEANGTWNFSAIGSGSNAEHFKCTGITAW